MTKGTENPAMTSSSSRTEGPAGRRRFEDLPPAAQRALKEAEARRLEAAGKTEPQREVGGRGGKDPARYGDWEIDGRAIDF